MNKVDIKSLLNKNTKQIRILGVCIGLSVITIISSYYLFVIKPTMNGDIAQSSSKTIQRPEATNKSGSLQQNSAQRFAAGISDFTAKSLLYSYIVILLALALLYSWRALRSYNRLHFYHSRIIRIVSTKESINNYLAIALYYVSIAVSTMKASIEEASAGQQGTIAQANAHRAEDMSAALLVSNQVLNAQSTNADMFVKHPQPHAYRAKKVWIPALVVVLFSVITNAFFIYANVLNSSPYRLAIEFSLLTLGVVLVGLAYRYQNSIKATLVNAEPRLNKESELYVTRRAYITEVIKTTASQMEALVAASAAFHELAQTEAFKNSFATLEGIHTSLQNLEKISDFSSSQPLLDITSSANKSIDSFSAHAKAKNITIKSKISSGVVSRIQPGDMRQIIDSLIANAIKFSKPDAEVTLSVYRRFNAIVVSATDNGAGISALRLPSLLQPFSQGADPLRSVQNGIGLDLYSDKVIADKLGGSITITSRLGLGTTTTIAIPYQHDVSTEPPVLQRKYISALEHPPLT